MGVAMLYVFVICIQKHLKGCDVTWCDVTWYDMIYCNIKENIHCFAMISSRSSGYRRSN
jgi:hypothetical protein